MMLECIGGEVSILYEVWEFQLLSVLFLCYLSIR